ncbi:hypothetical protein [Prosthecobacter sp.]|uniref:hypothetical protein n=1 Tax=Prosthecobacter sp. TaxID=1965333 RepID=UPI001D1DE50A|nr:hypothetical protein [Prosthecobacter sp.]MCB1277460.1 hypothetical protein [Prosthecobacter sp.]
MQDLAISDSETPSHWRRVLANLSVTYVWAYDTTAILDDYYDSEMGTLPAGQLIKFSAVSEQPDYILCDLDDPRMIERTQLSKGRVMRFRPWCFATRLQAVIAAADYEGLAIETERASWLRRFFRRMTRVD